MAENHPGFGMGQFSIKQVEIGPAYATCMDFYKNLIGIRLWNIPFSRARGFPGA